VGIKSNFLLPEIMKDSISILIYSGTARFIIPIGDYYTWSYNLELSSASYRRVSGEVEFTHEGFWTGHRNIYEFELRFALYQALTCRQILPEVM
jgi:hypothetical protein